MELEVKMSMWLDIDEIKAIKDDAEGNYFGSSGLLMDAKAKVVKNVLENYERQWDINHCHNQEYTEECPDCYEEVDIDETRCPHCYNGKYDNGDQ
tara:strand:+ start:240 stop:524 length:285 start_codon:yes stop_codon:yes gene_type:complete